MITGVVIAAFIAGVVVGAVLHDLHQEREWVKLREKTGTVDDIISGVQSIRSELGGLVFDHDMYTKAHLRAIKECQERLRSLDAKSKIVVKRIEQVDL